MGANFVFIFRDQGKLQHSLVNGDSKWLSDWTSGRSLPILNFVKYFPLRLEAREGGTLRKKWVGVCDPLPKTLIPSMT